MGPFLIFPSSVGLPRASATFNGSLAIESGTPKGMTVAHGWQHHPAMLNGGPGVPLPSDPPRTGPRRKAPFPPGHELSPSAALVLAPASPSWDTFEHVVPGGCGEGGKEIGSREGESWRLQNAPGSWRNLLEEELGLKMGGSDCPVLACAGNSAKGKAPQEVIGMLGESATLTLESPRPFALVFWYRNGAGLASLRPEPPPCHFRLAEAHASWDVTVSQDCRTLAVRGLRQEDSAGYRALTLSKDEVVADQTFILKVYSKSGTGGRGAFVFLAGPRSAPVRSGRKVM